MFFSGGFYYWKFAISASISLILPDSEKLPMYINQAVIKKATATTGRKHYHEISVELLKQLPKQIHDAIMVFDSLTRPDSLVIMTELMHKDESVVVTVHLSARQENHVINDIASVYSRGRDSDFVKWIEKGALRYINKQKALSWFRNGGLQLPEVETEPSSKRRLTEDGYVKSLTKDLGISWSSRKNSASSSALTSSSTLQLPQTDFDDMRLIDEIYTVCNFYGYRRLTVEMQM